MVLFGRRGFSLLEVMVAVAILGLALSVILGGQGGLAASNRSAQNLGIGGSLARCKMSEIEEKLLREGYTETDVNETDQSCCDTLDQDGFRCDYKIERVILPEANAAADAGTGSVFGASSAAPGASDAPAGPIAQLLSGGLDAGAGNFQQLGAQVLGSGGADGLVSMAMGIVYPSLKPMLEASIRRVTVAVKWKEGPKVRDVTLVQFVTNPQRSGLAGASGDGGLDPATSSSGGPGSSGSAGTSSGSAGTAGSPGRSSSGTAGAFH